MLSVVYAVFTNAVSCTRVERPNHTLRLKFDHYSLYLLHCVCVGGFAYVFFDLRQLCSYSRYSSSVEPIIVVTAPSVCECLNRLTILLKVNIIAWILQSEPDNKALPPFIYPILSYWFIHIQFNCKGKNFGPWFINFLPQRVEYCRFEVSNHHKSCCW